MYHWITNKVNEEREGQKYGFMDAVLASYGCQNKVPQIHVLEQKSEIKMSAGPCSLRRHQGRICPR